MSRDIDIETLTRPGGIVPVDMETTAALVRHVLRLRAALQKVRSYNVDIDAGRINYRPHDHIEVIDRALSSGKQTP